MKGIISIVLFLFFSVGIYGREYLPILAEGVEWTDCKPQTWGERHVFDDDGSNYIHRVVGDTVIAGKRCWRVMSNRCDQDDKPDKSVRYYHLYEEDGRLYRYFSEAYWNEIIEAHEQKGSKRFEPFLENYPFYLIMDMNLEKGERPFQSQYFADVVDYIEIGGKLRKRITFQDNFKNIKIRWVEGVIAENNRVEDDTDFDPFPVPTCFQSDVMISYRNGDFTFTPEMFGGLGNTVREDRVWEYESVAKDDDGGWNIRFAGKCYFDYLTEKNGKTYNTLRCYDMGGRRPDTYFFLRQEGGKVYLYRSWVSDADAVDDSSGEVLLYDFDAVKGDTYRSLSFADPFDSNPVDVELTVMDNGVTTIEGEEMRWQTVRASGSDLEVKVVEGIGSVNSGWINCPRWIEHGDATEARAYHQLSYARNRFYTKAQPLEELYDEQIIFRNTASRRNPNIIREDRVWEYVRPLSDRPGTSVYCRMKFDGEREVNGVMYNKFVTIDAKEVGRHVEGQDTICTMTRLPYEYVERLMREQSTTLYFLSQEEEDLPEGGDKFNAATWDFDKPVKECPHYDFFVHEGFAFLGTTDLVKSTYLGVESISEVLIDGVVCRVMYSPEFEPEDDTDVGIYSVHPAGYYVEGIGTVGEGMSMTYVPSVADAEPGNGWFRLSRVFNSAGEQIFPLKGEEYPLGWDTGFIPEEEGVTVIHPSGVERLDADDFQYITYANESVKSPGAVITIYDMSGTRVVSGRDMVGTGHLAPGVYIVNAVGKGSRSIKITI